MIFLLIGTGFDDVTITLRTGHRDARRLRNYHNLREKIALMQTKRMLSDVRELKIEK